MSYKEPKPAKEDEFTKENLDMYLNEVAKRYKKLAGRKMPAEIILIGGASVLVNYGFRNSTTDIDAIIQAASSMQEAIYYVSDKYGLSDEWLNADFKRTTSYSSKLIQHSEYYKTFANIVDIRTVKAEYLLAMKLQSGRRYKHDLSDIIGILKDEKKAGNEINLEMIMTAVEELYGSWDQIPEFSKSFINDVLSGSDYDKMYKEISEEETKTKKDVADFRKENPEKSQRKTANEIIEMLRGKENNGG